MALFHTHMPITPSGEFGSLFRLLDDYESHRAGRLGTSATGVSSYSPRFDVREEKDAYLLDGEIPGIEQKDINIEFTDSQTLLINGRTERSYQAGSPPARARGAIAEEEGAEGGGGSQQQQQQQKTSKEGGRYWVSERSVGEFQRSFNFPTRVDQDRVKASLKHGVLSVVIPKAGAPTTKRITVE